MRGMVLAMPGVEEQHPVERSHTMVGVPEGTRKFLRLYGAEKDYPAFVQWFEQPQRNVDRRTRRVFQFCPSTFLVWLDGRLCFGQCQATTHVGIHVAVRDVVNNLPHRPAAVAVRRVELRVVQSLGAARTAAGTAAISRIAFARM